MRGWVLEEREQIHGLKLALIVLLALVHLMGCATTGESRSGSVASSPLPEEVDEQVLEGGAVAEATLALRQVTGIASRVNEVGTRLSFTFWSERGALTLTGYTATGRAGPLAPPADGERLQEEVAQVLTHYAQRQTGRAQLTLERQQSGWTVGYSSGPPPRPLEAKTLPVRRVGVSAQAVEEVTRGVEQVLRGVQVPPGAQAQVELECSLEDGRAEQWRLSLFEVTREGTRGAPRSPSPAVRGETVAVLLPFTQGLGERTTRVRLRLWVVPGARQAEGWVEEAQVERPAPPAALNAQFVSEYRAMHEDILRRWREETRQGAEWVARRGFEEMAIWYAGGIALRGLGWLGGRVAPTVLRALQRGGGSGAGWLRTAITRLSAAERGAFERLWTKVQLEGKGSLAASERAELRELMAGLEASIHEPLGERAKKVLRDRAREVYKRLRPEYASALAEQGSELPIHHRHSLEYAHLFPEEDINDGSNLIMMVRSAHERINAIWIKFRRARPEATAEEVETVARVIDKQFEPWYHRATAPAQAPSSLKEAEETALRQLQRVWPGLE